MRHLSPDGTSYRLEGQTQLPPVVLCHGVGLDLNAWNAQVDVLSHQFQILRYDMLGHGETPVNRMCEVSEILATNSSTF